MSQRSRLLALGGAATVVILTAPLALAESKDLPSARTPWGDPNLGGIWASSTYTPLERPDHFAGRALLSEEELAKLNELVMAEGVDPLRAGGVLAAADEEERLARTQQSKDNIHYDNAVWLTEGRRKKFSSLRTSLIVDPPDGKVPPLTPAAAERAAERKKMASFDSYENRPLNERCLVWRHEGPPMMPPVYNDLLQIIQTEDHIVLLPEMNDNGPRIVPIDGPQQLSAQPRGWRGYSRGHWEGDTLVVETAGFNAKNPFYGSSESLHVVERFTPLGGGSMRYEFTVDDPETWTRPWSVEFPLTKRDGPLYEYACHEGNRDLAYILAAARKLEKEAAESSE